MHDVEKVAEALLTAHRDGGPYPTVTALAKRVDLNRTTFYRHFEAQAETMLEAARRQHTDGRQRHRPPRDDSRDNQLRSLREENENLRRHIEIYEEHLRMLTVENSRLREQVEAAAKVTRIGSRAPRRALSSGPDE
ncbi:hypothetical protein [Micromonospora sp. RV43]|uniref:hypothetical protein n=1 Tax=Micromonospora sp. RV43 TaxID=1661387 RepID=UPI00128C2C5D|nr:hypothetical protein [Micromonospora sp. RV43]